MAGSVMGSLFRVATWGESHGPALGALVEGCPAGLPIQTEKIQAYLDRRKPGQTKYATPRKENDAVSILSGVFEGVSTGMPIALLIQNENQRSADYTEIASYYRPGHADYTFYKKYGFRDYRGGGRSSGRETIGRVAAGAIAASFLNELGISICAYTKSIGPVQIEYGRAVKENISASPVCMPDLEASKAAEEYLKGILLEGDSAGGVIECIIKGVPAGIGEPVFDKLDACLAKAVLSIGGVKGFEIGAGFAAAKACGSALNDPFRQDGSGRIVKSSNHAGGVLGGISDGSEIVFRAAVKPTPSISKKQHTVNQAGEEIDISIKGRHDPVIVPRAVVVVECMAAIVLADCMLANMSSTLGNVKHFYLGGS